MDSKTQAQNDYTCLSFFDERKRLRKDEFSVAQLYCFELPLEREISIDFRKMSKRTANALCRNGITTLNKLLSLRNTDLMSFYAFGEKCFEELDCYLKRFDLGVSRSVGNKSNNVNRFFQYKERILSGNIELINRTDVSGISDKLYEDLWERYELVDSDLIRACGLDTEYVLTIIKSLESYRVKTIQNIRINTIMQKIPAYKRNNTVFPYLSLFAEERHIDINSLDTCDNCKVVDLKNAIANNVENSSILVDLLDYISYDLSSEFSGLMESVCQNNDRIIDILEMRIKNATLQEVGDVLGVSRERVRQLENKAVTPFRVWVNNNKFFRRLSSDFNGALFIPLCDLEKVFSGNTQLLLYLLSFCKEEHFSISDNNTLILYEKDLIDKATKYIDSLPVIFSCDDFDDYVMTSKSLGVPFVLFNHIFEGEYIKGNTTYYRKGVLRPRKYEFIMQKFFPTGLHIYDENEMGSFRKYFSDEFPETELPKADRSLGSAIARLSVLCGRGRYLIKKDKYISDELTKAISDYIDKSENTFFLVVTIFKAFEDELAAFGINNQYYLHGVLRELFEDKYYFSRDYVSKDSKSLSLYNEIADYIKKSNYPVSKQQIREAYPGITEIMIAFATSDENILNFDATYVHVDNLKLYDADVVYFRQVLSNFLGDNVPKHSRVIFDYIMSDNPDLLKRLGVYYQFSLFSLFEYLFSSDYEFSRPYIANKGVIIDKPKELIEEYVLSNDVVDVNELFEMANDYQANIMDKLKLLLSFNKTHLLVSKDRLVSIESIGINENDVMLMEKEICDELNETKRISDLGCIGKFPAYSIPWNEWFIFSAIYKWGKMTEVGTTARQFRYASPVIAIKGKLSLDDIKEDTQANEIGRIDDMDDFEGIADMVIDSIDW